MEWLCATDKATIYICEEGIFNCNSAQFSEQHNYLVTNWKFDCGDRTGPHGGTHSLSNEGFNHAISMAMLQST